MYSELAISNAYFLAIENQFPFECVLYRTRKWDLELAEIEIAPVLQDLAMAHSTNNWHGIAYDGQVLDLAMPQYALRKLDYEY